MTFEEKINNNNVSIILIKIKKIQNQNIIFHLIEFLSPNFLHKEQVLEIKEKYKIKPNNIKIWQGKTIKTASIKPDKPKLAHKALILNPNK